MKKLLLAAICMGAIVMTEAQQLRTPQPSTTQTVKQDFGLGGIELSYSRPNMKGRKIFGDLVPFDKVWRTGANEATVFEVSKDVTVEGKALKAGKYALFSIPGEKEWVIIFNKKSNQWGAYDYKESDDALRVTVPAKAGALTEKFTITAENSGKVTLAWDKAVVAFNVK